MSELYNLIDKYGSDKNASGYTHYYDELFKNLKTSTKNILEIGIGTLDWAYESTFAGNKNLFPQYESGGSLRAWRDYFINSMIYGVDIAHDCEITEDRINTFIFSSLDNIKCDTHFKDDSLDIIIDDGLHTALGQLSTLRNFFKKIKLGGLYVIEDCGGAGDGENIFVDFNVQFRKIADDHEYWFGGNFIVIRKTNSGIGQVHEFKEFLQLEKSNIEIKENKISTVGELKKYLQTFQDTDDINKLKLNLSNMFDISELISNKISTPSHKNELMVAENLTIVSGLWNINRAERDFSHYIENFEKFLQFPVNMFLYIPSELEELVWKHRTPKNTFVKIMELEDIKNNYYAGFWEKTQQIRTNPSWYNQTGEHGWLKGSPQAINEWYNPIVQSKMFMLHDAKVTNPFNTDYLIWLDAGITNTVNGDFFIQDRCFDNITQHLDKFLFLSYPYEANTEIHGFDFNKMNSIARQEVKYVCRGGLFGGHKDYISIANGTYYGLLMNSLEMGLMGTEESIFSIMAYREPHVYQRFSLDGNGLIVKYIQALIDGSAQLESFQIKNHETPKLSYKVDMNNTSLYVLSFNFPKQFMHLCESLLANDVEWTDLPKRKILINNSVDADIIQQYDDLCLKYGFEHIVTGENLGINRGRQFVAEHFDGSDSNYYIFFEDDMTLHRPLDYIIDEPNYEKAFCRNGFKKFIPGLWQKIHHIMAREHFDFMKLSFTEVFMDNNLQVSWYNVPQEIRTSMWPEYDQLPVAGLDYNCPRTKFDRIDSYDGLSYVTGEIYYANWPMIVSREGNRKMFLDTKWEYPYEQTWMSYMFQETIKGNIKPAVLLASPIHHERIHHYKPEERREN